VRGFPPALQQALEGRLAGKSRRMLAEKSSGISAAYHARRNSDAAIGSVDDALAYAVARMPATFAAMSFALDALASTVPELQPETLLDAGCGPGTAAFAASEVYPSLRMLTLVDRNGPLLALADDLCRAALAGRQTHIRTGDLRDSRMLPKADLVTAGYVLAELDDRAAEALVRALWAAAGMALVIAEPGTPDGFARLRQIRTLMLREGALVAAPCTHAAPCPMTGDRWCRFPVRLSRNRDHRALKGGSLGYEDEPVAYLALTRLQPAAMAKHRIVGPAAISKIGISLPVCGADGLQTLHAPSREREKLRYFRKLDWGDEV
jgi:ribosomal protein RSM22 (predicted rRNA methylase)